MDGDTMQRLTVIMHQLGNPMAVFELQKNHGVTSMSGASPEIQAAILAEAEAMLAPTGATVQ